MRRSDGSKYNKEELTGKVKQGRGTYRTTEKGFSGNVTFEQTMLVSAFLISEGMPNAEGVSGLVCSHRRARRPAWPKGKEGGRGDRPHGPCRGF